VHGSILNDAYTYLDEGKRFANRSPENRRGEKIKELLISLQQYGGPPTT